MKTAHSYQEISSLIERGSIQETFQLSSSDRSNEGTAQATPALPRYACNQGKLAQIF